MQVLVVGAGVVGLGIARAVARAGHEVIVAEAESAIGTVTSARNSEVIHAGLYYTTNSIRAQHCPRSRRMLYAYCAERGVPHRKIGKIVVASNDKELERLDEIYKQAQINGCENVELIDAAAVKKLEPEVFCLAAMNSPETGIIDSHRYMLALRGEIEDHGGVIALNTRIERLVQTPAGWEVHFGAGETIVVDAVVNAAGLGAQKLGRATEGYPQERVPKLALAKGNYFSYSGKPVFKRLVYPTPIPGGLGIHVVLDLGRPHALRSRRRMDRARELRRRSRPRGGVLRTHPRILAGAAGQLADPGLCRHPAEDQRAGRAGARLHHRRAEGPRRAAAGDAVRHRVAGADGVAVDRRGSGGLSVELNAAAAAVYGGGASRIASGGTGVALFGMIRVCASRCRISADNPE